MNGDGGTILNCYATGAVTGSADCVGGLVGSSGHDIINSYAVGTVKGVSYVGGLIGSCSGVTSECLARGSVTDPERGYHPEIGGDHEDHLTALSRLLGGFSLESSLTGRKGEPALYLKEADQIVRFLGLIGANAAVLAFENVRVKRDVRNRVNRLVNAESANMEKTVTAAVDQLEDIELIRSKLGLGRLPLALRRAAEARLAYPEASLRELGELVKPPVGKSGINYRMRGLAEIAQKLRIEAPSSMSRNRE
jgi:DNA-binding protein WhiA